VKYTVVLTFHSWSQEDSIEFFSGNYTVNYYGRKVHVFILMTSDLRPSF